MPILNDNPDPDYIPAPVAFSAAVPDDGSNTDQTFRNLLSDASRVLLAGDNLPPPPSSLTQYPATAAFISYFESNWLSNPHYPLKMWNSYDATLSLMTLKPTTCQKGATMPSTRRLGVQVQPSTGSLI